MTAKSWPIARTLRSAVAAAINEAWRNERRPSVAMTGPTRAGDKSTTPRYGVTLLRWGTRFAGEHGLVEKDLPAVRRITIRWKLDLILLNPPNHTSSIPA